MSHEDYKYSRLCFSILCFLCLFVATGAVAQQPAPSPSPTKSDSPDTPTEAGEKAGDYTAIGSVEFGYRGLSVDGDLNKYQSDLNYKAGPRPVSYTHLRAHETPEH